MLSTDSFEDAIADAINRGGDADTVGAVTGMIVGRLRYIPPCFGSEIRLNSTLQTTTQLLVSGPTRVCEITLREFKSECEE